MKMLRVGNGVFVASLLVACTDGTAPPKPAAVRLSNSTLVSGTVGAVLAPAPTFTIQDAKGNPIGGVAVAIAVTAGGGTLTGAPTQSADSPLSVGTWTLGRTIGINTLTITVAGLPPLLITATAVPDVPAVLDMVSGGNQLVLAATTVPQPVVVKVSDQYGNGVPHVSVGWTVAAGGGTLTGALATSTDDNGTATAPAWRLGQSAVPQSLTASAGTLQRTIPATVATNFHPDLRFFGSAIDPGIQQSFVRALQRLEGMVTGALAPVALSNFDVAGQCGVTGVAPLTETVSTMIIYATVTTIDGLGGILGSSGPCIIRSTGQLTVIGVMTFDVADFQGLYNDGRLDAVVFHEMQHVLGFGTLWSYFGLIVNAGTSTTAYTGLHGIQGCQAAGGGQGTCLPTVPLENTGGPGTANGHWRKTVFTKELMTGYLEAVGVKEPLSAMTIGSIADLGYVVNTNANDPYTLGSASLSALLQLREAQGLAGDGVTDTPVAPRYEVTSDGVVRALPRRP